VITAIRFTIESIIFRSQAYEKETKFSYRYGLDKIVLFEALPKKLILTTAFRDMAGVKWTGWLRIKIQDRNIRQPALAIVKLYSYSRCATSVDCEQQHGYYSFQISIFLAS
jgi:hypothetical protein